MLLSLAEAETLRCILHQRQGHKLIDGANCELALRCVSCHDTVFDQSDGFVAASKYQQSVSHNNFRFIDAAMHFSQAELNVLLRTIACAPAKRRVFFTMVLSCRRRLGKRWEQTPLAKLFTLEVSCPHPLFASFQLISGKSS